MTPSHSPLEPALPTILSRFQLHGFGLECSLEEFHASRIELRIPYDEILAVHDALEAFAAEDSLAAEMVKPG